MCYKSSLFQNIFFKSFYDKLKETLENKGITIFNIKTAIKEIKNWIQKTLSDMYNDVNLTFGELYVSQNIRYSSIK